MLTVENHSFSLYFSLDVLCCPRLRFATLRGVAFCLDAVLIWSGTIDMLAPFPPALPEKKYQDKLKRGQSQKPCLSFLRICLSPTCLFVCLLILLKGGLV